MTFAAVGSGTSITAATFSVNPQNAGDLFIASLSSVSATVFATGITGSNITWTQAGTSFEGAAPGNAQYCNVWLGKATATGSATQTISFSGATPTIHGYTHEFSSTVGSWALDGSQGNLNATTNTCPSLTPAQAGDIYWFWAVESGTGSAGSTTGYTYFQDSGTSSEGCYNPACSSAAQAPTFGNSDARTGIAILVKETASGPAGTVQPRASVPVPRRKPARALWQRITGQAFVQVGAPAQQPQPAPRRKPARAVIRFTPVTTSNAPPPVPPSGTVQSPATLPPPRRRPQRAQWRQATGQAYVQVPAPRQEFRLAPRRRPARAWIRFTPVTTVNVVPPSSVVNQWANSVGQGTTFTSITSALQSCVLQLDSTYSVGGGSGTPSEGNWLFAIASWTQDPALAEVHVNVADDGRDYWRQYPASSISGNTRTAIAYTANIGSPSVPLPSYVYCAPDGQVAALTLLVVEVSGLGPWDTVGAAYPVSNYAGAATSLSLSGGAPGAASFFIAGVGGDSTAASQSFAPAGWTALQTVSQSDGSDQLASSYLTSACLTAFSSSAQSVSASAGSATDLSGFMLAVYATGTDPIPVSQNPNWPCLKFEAAFGSGFNTPVSEMTWTDLTTRAWDWDEDSTGIQFQLGQLQATSGTVTLDNFDAALTSTNSSSPYYPDVQPGTPVRIRAALGTIGGVTVNRWYVIMRVTGEWTEKIGEEDYRRYVEVALTDLWTALSATPPTFYRSEVYADSPYAWWPCDDQPGTAGVLPTALLNAAPGNTNTLNVVLSPNGATVQNAYSSGGVNTTIENQQGAYPPGVAIYTAGASSGWMFGDPLSAASSISAAGNPVESTPGSAAWQASQQAGETGSYGFFLSCNDSGFPGLSGGVTIEIWFNAGFYGSSDGWVYTPNSGGPDYSYLTAQPYNTQLTIWEIATGSNPVCILYLNTSGHLILETFNGASGTTHSIYTSSDLRSSSWHMVTVELTATTWQVWLDGGENANVSGSGVSMTSAWTWLICNGDLGSNGGSSAGTGLVHGGNISLSHIAVYPVRLPFYRVLDHYWAAASAFGQLPAPTGVQISWVKQNTGTGAEFMYFPAQDIYTPDGSISPGQTTGSAFNASAGVSASVVVAATAGSVTSGPSAWASGATIYYDMITDVTTAESVSLWVSWTGLAPGFNVYTAASLGSETEAAVVCGDSAAFDHGYGSSADGLGVCQTASGSGASPPTSPTSCGDTVAQRIERLMHAGKTTSPSRCIDNTATQLVQAPGSLGGGVQASAAIQQIQQSDSGMLYIDPQNNLVYWSRPHLAAQYSAPVWTLTPDAPPTPGASASAIPYYRDLGWPTDPQKIINVITVAPLSPTGAALPEYTPTNASAVEASQNDYGANPYSVSSWLQSTSEMQSQANFLFTNWGVPRRRVENAKVDAAPYPAAWPLVLGISPGDVASIQDWAIGPAGTSYIYRVTQFRRHIEFGGAGDRETIGAVWVTADYEPSSYFS